MQLHVSALILLASVRGLHSMGIGEDRKHGPGISEKKKIIGSLIHVPSARSEELPAIGNLASFHRSRNWRYM